MGSHSVLRRTHSALMWIHGALMWARSVLMEMPFAVWRIYSVPLVTLSVLMQNHSALTKINLAKNGVYSTTSLGYPLLMEEVYSVLLKVLLVVPSPLAYFLATHRQ